MLAMLGSGMATELLLVREGTKLGAADPFSFEAVESLGHGEMVTATIKRTRNPGHHRKFFALLKVVFEAQDRYATLEQLLDAVKIQTGYYDLVTLPGPVPVQMIKPRSISFARLDQAGFTQFYDKAVIFVLTELLPGIDRADLELRVLDIIGDAGAAG